MAIKDIFLLIVTILAADQDLWHFELGWRGSRFLTSYRAGTQARIFAVAAVDWSTSVNHNRGCQRRCQARSIGFSEIFTCLFQICTWLQQWGCWCGWASSHRALWCVAALVCWEEAVGRSQWTDQNMSQTSQLLWNHLDNSCEGEWLPWNPAICCKTLFLQIFLQAEAGTVQGQGLGAGVFWCLQSKWLLLFCYCCSQLGNYQHTCSMRSREA